MRRAADQASGRRTATEKAAFASVETSMYRPLAVLRTLLLVNAIGLFVYRGLTASGGPWSNTDHVTSGVLVLAALAVWTGVAVWAYDRPQRRRAPLLGTDLLIALAAILVSPMVKGAALQATLPGFWVGGVVLAWAVHWGWAGGCAAALAISAADLSIRSEMTTVQYGNILLVLLCGLIVGYASGLLKQMAVARDQAQREAAEARERAQLARVVHDGVLQVLSLMQRRGAELGGEVAELGRLAADQEAALRALVQRRATASPVGSADLAGAVSRLQSVHVTVSVPGGPVVMSADAVREVLAVVRTCLDNVRRHVGEDAAVWVAVEDRGDRVLVSVRDDGPGIPPGRLETARAEGRLGVSESIQGRVSDLGGTADLVSAPGQGTEWEITVPKTAAVLAPDGPTAGSRS
jgi:signal transduction histidine kinase